MSQAIFILEIEQEIPSGENSRFTASSASSLTKQNQIVTVYCICRWKGENVSTSEVEAVISNLLNLEDAVVYGVKVKRLVSTQCRYISTPKLAFRYHSMKVELEW